MLMILTFVLSGDESKCAKPLYLVMMSLAIFRISGCSRDTQIFNRETNLNDGMASYSTRQWHKKQPDSYSPIYSPHPVSQNTSPNLGTHLDQLPILRRQSRADLTSPDNHRHKQRTNCKRNDSAHDVHVRKPHGLHPRHDSKGNSDGDGVSHKGDADEGLGSELFRVSYGCFCENWIRHTSR